MEGYQRQRFTDSPRYQKPQRIRKLINDPGRFVFGLGGIVFLSLLVVSCAGRVPGARYYSGSDDDVRIDVPFIRQQTDYCGPAALAAVMQFLGQHVDQEDIAAEVYIPALRGSLITDLDNYARKSGFSTRLGALSLDTEVVRHLTTSGSEVTATFLTSYLDQHIPVIVLVNIGRGWISVPHYLVIIGYIHDPVAGQTSWITHTGYRANVLLSNHDLYNIWEPMGFSYLILLPAAYD